MHAPFALRLAPALASAIVLAACGSSNGSSSTDAGPSTETGPRHDADSSTSDARHDAVETGTSIAPSATLQSLTISPAPATLESLNGAAATKQLEAIGKYTDGTTHAVASVEWSSDNPQIGTIDSGTGLFTASGVQGGTATITAKSAGKQATGTLTVTLHLVENPSGATAAVQTALKKASKVDKSMVLAYPYDGTVFPRGIGEAPLMWLPPSVDAGAPDAGTTTDAGTTDGAVTSDVYYVKLSSPTFVLESYSYAPHDRYDFSGQDWEQFVASTSGAATLVLHRWNGTTATTIASQSWTIAPASMRGTIYYWAINTGRVMRIQPGAAAPDDFLGASVTCPACHTVSANGQQLLMNEGEWPDETSVNYDLQSSANSYSGLVNDGGASPWALPGVSPDGKVIIENFAPLRGNMGVQTGAFDSITGAIIPDSGVDGLQLFMPAFSPDGKLLAYVDSTTGDLHAFDWDDASRHASSDRLIAASSLNPAALQIQFPTVSPDHQWIVYGRGTGFGSLGVPGNLYVASVANPGAEIPLDALNGASYPFAAGSRDQDLDYEPTFAPVAAGGYFWVVFHSRRTWGNAITGPAYVAEGQGVKQLWVAAFDQSPAKGKDPSHPAFYLPGQDAATLNMRGYWSLAPCKANGASCQSGVDCCGGYCAPTDGGKMICSSTRSGCSEDGDKCAKASDCCGAASGEVCINGVCSSPAPR